MPLHKGHFLISGVTRSGKGQFLRGVIDGYRKKGFPVLFYSSKKAEIMDVGDMVDYSTTDAMEYFDTLKKAAESGKYAGIIAVMDEATDFFESARPQMREIMNSFAAYGVEVFIAVQRAKMVPPNIRNACENIVCFRQRPDDAAYVAEQYGQEFTEAADLMPSYFLARQGGFGEVVRGRSYDDSKGKFQRV